MDLAVGGVRTQILGAKDAADQLFARHSCGEVEHDRKGVLVCSGLRLRDGDLQLPESRWLSKR